jgi:NADH-quinone oxidoreductase subunit G
MAAVTENATELVRITINEVEIDVPKGELIVESVKRLGLEIPIFCYHPRMKPVGMCRMCLVEVGFKQPDGAVRKMPKPQAGCSLPASEGMVVYTDTELVHRDRKGVLEFLLINHPLDCPICDRGGECPLQNNTLFYGPSTSRYIEVKRHLPKAYPLSKHVTLDLERCIQCGRCVRFTEEISGDSQLAFRFRGAQMQPSTFQLLDFESKFSGNVIEICPVGALTSTHYRFRARPWDLETAPAVCTLCSNGCNIWLDHRVGKFVRVNGRTNEAVNEEWTCDRGKFGHDFYNASDRLKSPLVRQNDVFVPTGWAEAYSAILDAFSKGGNHVGGLCRATFSNEGLFLFQRLFREVFRSNNVDHRWRAADGRAHAATTIADLESRSAILWFGGSPADDLPIVYLRARKAWFRSGAKIVVASDQPTDADSFAHIILRYAPGTGARVAAALLAALRGEPVESADTGVAEGLIREAAALLGPEAAIVTATTLFHREDAPATMAALTALSEATGAPFNCYAVEASEQGACDLGVLPDRLPGGVRVEEGAGLGTFETLRACADGRVKALWLVDADPFRLVDRELAERALENVEFLVVQGIQESEAMAYASVVLPMEAPAEQDGSYTNCEGRVQRMRQALPAPGDAKPAWRIFAECILRAKPQAPFFNAGEIMAAIGQSVPAYATAAYANLEGEGVVIRL